MIDEEIGLLSNLIFLRYRTELANNFGYNSDALDLFKMICTDYLLPVLHNRDKKILIMAEALGNISSENCYNPQYVAQVALREVKDVF